MQRRRAVDQKDTKPVVQNQSAFPQAIDRHLRDSEARGDRGHFCVHASHSALRLQIDMIDAQVCLVSMGSG
jgi:hypothetical protein